MMPFAVMMLAANSSNTPPASGALVTRSNAVFSSTSGAPIDWTAESYDRTAWHDLVTNNSRLTVPAGLPTSLIRVAGSITANTEQSFRLMKNGAVFDGQGKCKTICLGDHPNTLWSGIVGMTAADYFEMVKDDTTTTAPVAAGNWLGAELLDATTKYCLVRKNATQAIATGATDTLTWQTEIADVGGWFGTNSTDFVVPSGVTRIRVTMGLEANSFTGQLVGAVRVNGAAVRGGFTQVSNSSGSATKYMNCATAVLAVSPGDVITLLASATNAAIIQNNEKVWACIEEVPNYDRCLLYRSASQALVSGSQAISWDSEVIDSAGAHDLVTNPSRVTMPAGKSQVRFSYGLDLPNGESFISWISKVTGGSTRTPGGPQAGVAGGSSSVNSLGLWMDATPGDEWDLRAFTGTVTLVDSNSTWLCAEFR